MGNSQPTLPRRTILHLSALGLVPLSGCLDWLGLGGDDSSDEDDSSDGSNPSDEQEGDSTPDTDDGSGNDTGAQNTSENESRADAENQTDGANESPTTNETDPENENEGAVPESNPENDPSDMEPAEPGDTQEPTQDDLRLEESYYSKRDNEAVITVTNTSDYRMRSIDFWVTFYDENGATVGKNVHGASSVDPGQEVTVRVPCNAENATTFSIDRVIVK